MRLRDRRWFEREGVAAKWRPSLWSPRLQLDDRYLALELDELQQVVRARRGPCVLRSPAWVVLRQEISVEVRYDALQDRSGNQGTLVGRVRLSLPTGERGGRLFLDAVLTSASEVSYGSLSRWIVSVSLGAISQAVASQRWTDVPSGGDLGLNACLFGGGVALSGTPAWQVIENQGTVTQKERSGVDSKARTNPSEWTIPAAEPLEGWRRAPVESVSPKAVSVSKAGSQRSLAAPCCLSVDGRVYEARLNPQDDSIAGWIAIATPSIVGQPTALTVRESRSTGDRWLTIGGTSGIATIDAAGSIRARHRIPVATESSFKLAPNALHWSRGQLWAAGGRCGVWCWPHPSDSRRQLGPEPLPSSEVIRIIGGAQQEVWLGRDRHLFRWSRLQAPLESSASLPSPISELMDDGDRLWVGTREGEVYRFEARSGTLQGSSVASLPGPVRGLVSWRNRVIAMSERGDAVVLPMAGDDPAAASGSVRFGIRSMTVDQKDRLWGLSRDGRHVLLWSDPAIAPRYWELPFSARQLAVSEQRRRAK